MADNDANINDAAAVFTIIVLWPMNPNKSHYFTRMHATLWLRIQPQIRCIMKLVS